MISDLAFVSCVGEGSECTSQIMEGAQALGYLMTD
jgi:hypothetical protein